MRLTLIHNPEAGRGGPSREELVALLRSAGHRVQYQSTAESTVDRALDDPGELVLAAGGDGTVAKVAKRLVGRDVPLAIIPLGTANNIARSVGAHGSAREVIAGLPAATVTALDVGLARVRREYGSSSDRFATARTDSMSRFIEAVGVGLFGRLLHGAEERREREGSDPATTPVRPALRGIRRALEDYGARHRRVVVDGEDASGSYLMVTVMNIRSIGPRMTLAPDADPGDGRLDVLLLTEADRAPLADYLTAIEQGDDARFPIAARRARHVSVGWDDDEGHLDDEAWPDSDEEGRDRRARASDTVEAEIVDPPLRVLVPA